MITVWLTQPLTALYENVSGTVPGIDGIMADYAMTDPGIDGINAEYGMTILMFFAKKNECSKSQQAKLFTIIGIETSALKRRNKYCCK